MKPLIQVVLGLTDIVVVFGLAFVGAMHLFGLTWAIVLVVVLVALNAGGSLLFMQEPEVKRPVASRRGTGR